jgi:hypothetical protein
LITRETVLIDTLASFATSSMDAAIATLPPVFSKTGSRCRTVAGVCDPGSYK